MQYKNQILIDLIAPEKAVLNMLFESGIDNLQFYKSFIIDNQNYTGQMSTSEVS